MDETKIARIKNFGATLNVFQSNFFTEIIFHPKTREADIRNYKIASFDDFFAASTLSFVLIDAHATKKSDNFRSITINTLIFLF